MQKTNFDWHCIFYSALFVYFTMTINTIEPLPWLILSRLHKSCLTLQCIGVGTLQCIGKKLINGSQKRGKISFFYKSVDVIIFLPHLKFYQNFKNYHAETLNKTDLVNIYFA